MKSDEEQVIKLTCERMRRLLWSKYFCMSRAKTCHDDDDVDDDYDDDDYVDDDVAKVDEIDDNDDYRFLTSAPEQRYYVII